MLIYKKIIIFLSFYGTVALGITADKVRGAILEKSKKVEKALIKEGFNEEVTKKIAKEIIYNHLLEYENNNFLMENKDLIKDIKKDWKKFEMSINHDVEIDLVEHNFENKNEMFDKRLKHQEKLDDKEIYYEANKEAKKTETLVEEHEKARLRGLNKALQGNEEEDKFGRKSPSVANIIDKVLWKQIAPAVLNPYQLLKATSLIGGTVGGTYFLGWYAPVIIYTFIKPRPTALLPGSKIGLWDRLRRWKNRYQSPAMIFPTEVEERLSDIENITQMIKADIKAGLKRTYRNVMLWGPPGTGKTLFANVLADRLNMDFCSITAGSLLQKDVGVQFLNEFEKMARNSRYGMILFIDEADALFILRDKINTSTAEGLELYKVLNHLLALTGDGSNKFMLVVATNHAQNIDEAMGRRFQERIYMPLPDHKTREKLVNLYIKQLLFSEVNNGSKFVKHAKKAIDSALLKDLVAKTEGLSGAEIKDIIVQVQNLGLQTKNKKLTADHVQKALKQGIQKRKDQDNDIIMRNKQQIDQNKGAVVYLTVSPDMAVTSKPGGSNSEDASFSKEDAVQIVKQGALQ